jgi:hypothetical protein
LHDARLVDLDDNSRRCGYASGGRGKKWFHAKTGGRKRKA